MITCCYNQQEVVGDAFRAMLAQDYHPLEIVISDDCSQDETYTVLQRIAADYAGPHKIVLNRNPRNLGIAAHIDRVTELASGEFIVGGAGDDVSLPDRVSRFAEAWIASNRQALVIHGACILLDNDGGDRQVARPPAAIRKTPSPIQFVQQGMYVIGANMGWSKQLNAHFGPVARHALVEDHVLPFRAALLGQIAYIDEPLVRKRPGGMADLAVPENGHDSLFGLYLKELPWKIADLRQFRSDLDRVDRKDKKRILKVVRRTEALHKMEYRMAKAGFGRRLSMFPGEAVRSIWNGHRTRLKRALYYAAAPLSTWLIDRKMRRSDISGQAPAT
ncbi:MAG: glycosyltransferase [Pontixanthobacter sp.]